MPICLNASPIEHGNINPSGKDCRRAADAAAAIGEGILISNGVSQLNELDKKEEPKVEEPQKEEPQKEEPQALPDTQMGA